MSFMLYVCYMSVLTYQDTRNVLQAKIRFTKTTLAQENKKSKLALRDKH